METARGGHASVLEGKVRVQTLVDRRKSSIYAGEKSKPRFPTRVEIDNEVSADYSVIDIYTHDNVGLLYRITATLSELGLYIGVAKISTKVDQVADVFYVRDIFGQKILPGEAGGNQKQAAGGHRFMNSLLDLFLAYILVEKGLSKNTLEAYSRDLCRYLAFLDKRGCSDCQW